MSNSADDDPRDAERGEEEDLEANFGDAENEEENYEEEQGLGAEEGEEEYFEEATEEQRESYFRQLEEQEDEEEGVPVDRQDGNEEQYYEGARDDEQRENEDQMDEYDDENQAANYEAYDPDEDDDFPEYANEKNKKLNEDIKFTRRNAKQIASQADDIKERLGIMKEHQKYIMVELKNTQTKIEMKNEEADTEKHLSQLADRQLGKITADLRKLDQEAIENQDRLNDTQQQIFKGNDELEKLKLDVNWNKEEKQQWIVAVKQKEEDNMTLAKFKKKDDTKLKELDLKLKALTKTKNSYEEKLEKEITETQARQIEIDKAAEEFKKHHAERHRIYAQWDEAIQNIAYRHEATLKITTENVTIQMQMKNNKSTLEEKKEQLERERISNKKDEDKIKGVEKEIADLKIQYEDLKNDEVDLNADVKINQNTLSADSSKLASKKQVMEMLEKELQNRKDRLTNAENKYKNQKDILKSEEAIEKLAMEAEQVMLEENNEVKKQLENKDKQIKNLKDETLIRQNILMDKRKKEANLYSDIQGTMAALRNLQAQINKLHQELSRQQELLYNAEYQIQLLERKVARAKGEKSTKETEILNQQLKTAAESKQRVDDELKKLERAIKDLADERRTLEHKIKTLEKDREKEIKGIEKLNLENQMTLQELNKIVKEKENAMVQHDIMKLEILKIQDRLSSAQNDVLELENKKNQLELGLAEREKEIMVHKGVLLAEHKAAEQERHKIAVELAKRQTIVKNFKIKFESLIQAKQGSSGGNIHEHSQAYYMIKAGQEKEELQRKEDELNAKIAKSTTDLTALKQTKNHLMIRNTNYRDYFENRGWTRKDVEQKAHLDDQLKIAGDNLIKKRTEYQKLKAEIEENVKVFNESQSRLEVLYDQSKQAEGQFIRFKDERDKQDEKKVRAERFLKRAQDDLKKSNIEVDHQGTSQLVLAQIEDQINIKKTLHSVIHSLFNDYPEAQGLLEICLKQNNVEVPQQAPSSVHLSSRRKHRHNSRL